MLNTANTGKVPPLSEPLSQSDRQGTSNINMVEAERAECKVQAERA